MKLEVPEITLESNMNQKDINFTLDSESYVIFDILRNKIYSDPIQSTVREILSNARDANQESGNENVPVRVFLNGTEFIVHDNGPGISPWRMENVISKYGKSTKRESNDQLGAWGLGFKSFFAYTDSATIETNVDGIKYFYLAYLDKTNKGGIKLIKEQPTEDPDGTKIKVPIKPQDRNKFRDDVNIVTKYWDVPPDIFGEGRRTAVKPIVEGTGWIIYPQNTIDEYNIIYAGIPYTDNGWYSIPGNVVLKFNIGDLEVTASRENLSQSERNKKAIGAALEVFRKEIIDHVKDQIDNAEKFEDVVRVIHATPDWETSKEYEWKGHKFHYPLTGNQTILWFDRRYGTKLQLHHNKYLMPYSYFSANTQFLDSQVITLDRDEMTSYDRQRVSYYMKENNLPRVFLIHKDQFPVTGPDLSSIKVKRPGSGGPRQPKQKKTEIKGKLLGHWGRYSKKSYPIDSTEIVVYKLENDPDLHYTWRELLNEVLVITEKDEKLITGNPNWMKFDKYVKKYANLVSTQEAQRIADNIKNSNTWNKLSFLADKFDEFKPTKYDTSIKEEQKRYVNWLVAKGDLIPQDLSFYKKYPLLEALGWIHTNYYQHVIDYVTLIKKQSGEI